MSKTADPDRLLIRTWLREFRIPLVRAFRQPVCEETPRDLTALLERADRRRTICGPDRNALPAGNERGCGS
jgi:hypothetical protein